MLLKAKENGLNICTHFKEHLFFYSYTLTVFFFFFFNIQLSVSDSKGRSRYAIGVRGRVLMSFSILNFPKEILGLFDKKFYI